MAAADSSDKRAPEAVEAMAHDAWAEVEEKKQAELEKEIDRTRKMKEL